MLTEAYKSLLLVYVPGNENTSCKRTNFTSIDNQNKYELVVALSVFALYFFLSRETGRVIAPCGAITLPECASTRGQLAAMLLTHEHRVRFDFVINIQLTADIDDHLLDRTGERPGILARVVPRDRLTTIAPHV
jgi:hypothetical protein